MTLNFFEIITNAKITYFNSGDYSAADIWVEWSSKKIVDGVPLSAGFKVPLYNDFDGNDVDKTFLLYLSASSFFE